MSCCAKVGRAVFDLGDEPHEVEIDANPEWNATTFRYGYQSLTTPMTIYEADVRTDERSMLKQTPAPDVDVSKYDGHTRVGDDRTMARRCPSTSSADVDTPVDGTAPCMVYGYGSYESSDVTVVQRGATLAAGSRIGCGHSSTHAVAESSVVVGTPTASCSTSATRSPTPSPVVEHLIAAKLGATRSRSSIRGGSAGGLLVGACMTMRPDLFAAVVAEVPFVDVVTTM